MLNNLIKQVSKIVVGNENKIKLTLAAILSEGSVLIEDNPGSGKTTFAKTITLNLGLNFKRIQFTSDLLPSDILGFNIFKNEELNFQQGPIFTNIVLADELNRGSPKSQSAFLEAMEEKNISIDGQTYKLPDPFFVIATQNPMDSSGTSTLPDSQLDRFMISFSLSELNDQDKILMLKNNIDLDNINCEKINWREIKDKKNQVNVSDEIYNYVLEIEQTIRSLDQQIYISPRCLKQIIDLGRGWAMIHSKNYVTHQDIKDLLPYVLKHRIKFVINEILNKINIKK